MISAIQPIGSRRWVERISSSVVLGRHAVVRMVDNHLVFASPYLLDQERNKVDITSLLGDDADNLLSHQVKGISKEHLGTSGPDFVDRVVSQGDRSPQVMRNLQALFGHGRLAGTGYVSILPVDQGIEHSAAASFAPNPIYFDPANICELAMWGDATALPPRSAFSGLCHASTPTASPSS